MRSDARRQQPPDDPPTKKTDDIPAPGAMSKSGLSKTALRTQELIFEELLGVGTVTDSVTLHRLPHVRWRADSRASILIGKKIQNCSCDLHRRFLFCLRFRTGHQARDADLQAHLIVRLPDTDLFGYAHTQ